MYYTFINQYHSGGKLNMKLSKKSLLCITALILIAVLWSCGGFELETGDIPKSSLSIPGALTSDSGSRATSQDGVFSPFRSSLEIADEILAVVNGFIDEINATYIPDSYSGLGEDGETYFTISTDESREYSKRIEFSEAVGVDPFLQINYTPGTTEGELYWKDTDAPAGQPAALKVYYDASTSSPVLQGWLVVYPDTTEPTYPKNLYFKATKTGDIIKVEGGLAYHYTIPATVDYPTDSESDRAYMFKSYTDAEGEKAAVSLYFPKDTVSTVTEDHDVQSSVIESYYDFYIDNGVTDFNPILGQQVADLAEFKSVVLSLTEAQLGPDLAFLLSLENPIAYNTSGYVANGSPLPSGYATADLGDPSTITFSQSPVQIAALTSAGLAPLSD